MTRLSDPEDRKCINHQIRSTNNFTGIAGKIPIGPNGKAQRPLCIDSIQKRSVEISRQAPLVHQASNFRNPVDGHNAPHILPFAFNLLAQNRKGNQQPARIRKLGKETNKKGRILKVNR